MRFMATSSLFAFVIAISTSAIAGGGSPESITGAAARHSFIIATSQTIATDLVTRDTERRSQIDLAVAPIRSAIDLRIYDTEQLGKTPLDAIPSSNRSAFIRSLKFNERGITEFNYKALSGLTPIQAYQVLALFGQQRITKELNNLHSMTPDDNLIMMQPTLLPVGVGFRCGPLPGTCTKAPGFVCTENC